MLNRLADLVRLRAYADLLVQPVGRAAAATLLNLPLGAQVIAHVELARADGTVRATIDGQQFELRLPFNARAGQDIALRVAAREPQLRFTIEPGSEPAPRAALLSATARFITALLAESEKLPVATLPAGGPPLLEGPPDDSRRMANVLRGALADSGMFYESHQAQWLADERPLAALLREPQSRLPPLAADGAAEATPAGMPQLRELPVHRDALTMVRQQLETLETQHVVWQGSLWPGQTIEWQVGEAPTQESATDDGREWRSHLRLTLPRLGGVEATLLVSALGVRVSLRAETETSAAMLDQNRRSLRTALTDAGVTPLSIGVLHAGA